MVFSPANALEEQSTPTSDDSASTDLAAFETAERVSQMLSPFVQLLTVVVQALTAYTLVRQL